MPKKNTRKFEYLKNLNESNILLRQVSENISFSFKFYQYGKNSGQSFEEWEEDEILADLNNKLKSYSEKKKQELLQDRTLEIYNSYPPDSKFVKPKALAGRDIQWARLRITGGRRLIGFFICDTFMISETDSNKVRDVFYIVFLDKNHEFAPYKK